MPWPTPALALLFAGATAAVTAAVARPVLRALPEPVEDAAGKTPYAALATPRVVTAVAAVGLAAGLLASLATPWQHWVAWASLTTACLLACTIDARTTWLPLPLAWAGWAIAAAGAGVAAATAASWTPLLAAAVGALALGGVFHLLWRFTGAFGYGDVRLAATIGAVTALDSAGLVVWSLLLGTSAGAAVGVLHRLRGGRGAFPYGPGLLAGPFLALALRLAAP